MNAVNYFSLFSFYSILILFFCFVKPFQIAKAWPGGNNVTWLEIERRSSIHFQEAYLKLSRGLSNLSSSRFHSPLFSNDRFECDVTWPAFWSTILPFIFLRTHCCLSWSRYSQLESYLARWTQSACPRLPPSRRLPHRHRFINLFRIWQILRRFVDCQYTYFFYKQHFLPIPDSDCKHFCWQPSHIHPCYIWLFVCRGRLHY